MNSADRDMNEWICLEAQQGPSLPSFNHQVQYHLYIVGALI